MIQDSHGRVAILYPGDEEVRRNAMPNNNRFAPLFSAFTASGIDAEPAVYHDDFCQTVREQLLQVDGVLVWVNPIEGGRDRSMLDAMRREVAEAGIKPRQPMLDMSVTRTRSYTALANSPH